MNGKKDTIANNSNVKTLVFILCGILFSGIGFAQQDIIAPINHWGGYAENAAVQGDYAYLVKGGSLTILDISGAEMEKVAALILPDERTPIDIFVHGNYAYYFVNGSDSALQIVDISNPTTPFFVGVAAGLFQEWGSVDIYASGDYVYLAMEESFKVVDVSVPAAPYVVSTLEISVNAVFIVNNHAYVGGNNNFKIFDVANPAAPVEIGSCTITSAVSVFVQGSFAYIGTNKYDHSGMFIIDISDSQNPFEAGFFETKIVDGPDTFYKRPCEVVVEGDYAYVGCTDGWLFIADVSEANNPVETGKLELTEGAFPSAKSIDVKYPNAYIATGASSAGFLKINIEDPANPEIENRLEEPWDILNMYSWIEKLYVSSFERLWIYDCSEPEKPLLLGSDAGWPELRRIFIKCNNLYGLRDSSMFIIDVADPGNMFEVGNYSSARAEELREVKVAGNYAYLLVVNENQSWLEIVNVENLSTPFLVNEFPLPGEGRDLAIQDSGTVAYVAYYADDTNQGLQIIDASNTASLSNLGSAQTVGKPICIWVADTIAYLGSNLMTAEDSTWYIESFSVADVTAPKKIAEISDSGLIVDLVTYRKLLLASIHTGSIYTFDALLMQFLKKCHSPASIYFAMVVSATYQYISIFSMDGWFDFAQLFASASLGIFGQRLDIKPEAAKIKVIPPDTSVAQGSKVQFTTTAYDSSGYEIKTKIKWTTSGGEIDSTSGLYTATEDGDFTVTAIDSSSNVTGAASVHVTATGVEQYTAIPIEFSLSQNYPNPFNPVTSIAFSVKEKCDVVLKVFDIRGREAAVLVNDFYTPGFHRVNFNAQNFATGIYFYQIEMKYFRAVRKMVLLE